jgi:hypothetical protein
VSERVRAVNFPEETTETIECPITGEQIPVVLVARWSPTIGHVYCPVCSARRRERIWHQVDLTSSPR